MNTAMPLVRISIVLGLGVFAISGCSPALPFMLAQTPTVSALPTSAATLTPAATSTPATTSSVALSATGTPTTPSPVTSPTATRRPATPRPRATATSTSAAPPGIYVSAIKIDPTPVVSNQPPTFTVTFLNTTSQTQRYRWFVKIYQPDQPQSFGETAREDSDIVLKTSQLKSSSGWKTTAVLQCMPMIARVFWADQNNQVTEFLKPDGSSPATGFNICPPS